MATINENKNIALSKSLGAIELKIGNAKYLYNVGILSCSNVRLYYITEDNGLYVISSPNSMDENQKGKKVTSSKVAEFLGEDHREDGDYLKILLTNGNIEYIKYFTTPDYWTE